MLASNATGGAMRGAFVVPPVVASPSNRNTRYAKAMHAHLPDFMGTALSKRDFKLSIYNHSGEDFVSGHMDDALRRILISDVRQHAPAHLHCVA